MMPSDPVKAHALKILDVLASSAMDGYRLLKRTGLTEPELIKAYEQELRTMVSVDGSLTPDRVGEAYFSILPSDLGRAKQTMNILSNLP
jgi:hypothetical protein